MEKRTGIPHVLQDFIPFGATALLPLSTLQQAIKQGKGIADHLLPRATSSQCHLEVPCV